MKYPTDGLHHGDTLDIMRKWPDGTFKVIVTSPPYNLSNTTGGLGGTSRKNLWRNSPLMDSSKQNYPEHEDNMPHEEYVAWQRECLAEMIRLLTDDGALFYNHKWRTQAGRLQERHDITDGFPLRQIIIWERNGAIPQGSTQTGQTFFMPNMEQIFMFCKSDKFRLEQGSWGRGVIWRMNHARGNPHPAPFPIELPVKCITSVKGWREGIVMDPFMGSGTTALAAEKLGIEWAGIENSKEFCDLTARRLEEASRQATLDL